MTRNDILDIVYPLNPAARPQRTGSSASEPGAGGGSLDARLTEHWKPVVGYEGLYEVSDLGRVRSLARVTTHGHPVASSYLKPIPQRAGHLRVMLCDGPSHTCIRFIHVLVLEAFVGLRPKGAHSRHFPDRDPTNNALTNLSWGTRKENEADKAIHGTRINGERQHLSKLTVEDVKAIRRRATENQYVLAREFNVSQVTIWSVLRRRTWKHV